MIRATFYLDRAAFLKDRVPGSFWIGDPGESGTQDLLFYCPCGCGAKSLLTIGNGFKPAFGPSWLWNGSTTAPDLRPSVNWEGHWHGWLKDGAWRAC